MGKHDLLKDPYFGPIFFRLESAIAAEDRQARAAGTLTPKDSAVKSAVRKAELALAGKSPKNPPEGALEEWTAALARTLVQACRDMAATHIASLHESTATLGAIRASLDIRRDMSPGNPRGYLEFLENFMTEGDGPDPLH